MSQLWRGKRQKSKDRRAAACAGWAAQWLEPRRLLSAVVAAPDTLTFADSVSGPLAPLSGHTFYVSGTRANGTTPTQYSDASAITPNTTNDLVMNVSPFSTTYTPCCEGLNGTAGTLTNGITQTQTGVSPGAGLPAVGDGLANDASNNTNVISQISSSYSMSYNLGTANGASASATGYDLSEIDIITGHQDYRTAINGVDILVQPVGSSQFISLSGSAGFSFVSSPNPSGGTTYIGVGSAQMAIVSSTPGQPLAQNISAVKFVALDASTWFRELVVTGTPGGSPLGAAPAVPTNVSAALGTAGIALSWNAAAGAAGYTVYRSTTANGQYAAVGSTVGAASLVDATAQPNTTYYYKVAANGHGDSAQSAASTPFAAAFGTSAYVYPSQLWQGTVAITENLPLINYQGGPNATVFPLSSAVPAGTFSTFIEGKVTTDLAGTYTFFANTDDDGYLWVNGQLVSSNPGGHVQRMPTTTIPIALAAGTSYDFVFLHDNRGAGWGMQMSWQEPTSTSGPAGPITVVPANRLTPTVDAPLNPTEVSATAFSDTTVQLTWPVNNDASSYGYVIERAPSDSVGNTTGPFSIVGQSFSGTGALLSNPNSTWGATSFIDQTVTSGGNFVYKVGVILPGQTTPATFSAQSNAVGPTLQGTNTVVVNSNSDTAAGPGVVTLRGAIATANTAASPTTITFDPTVFGASQTITLGSPLELSSTTQPIRIVGPQNGLTISANNLGRAFLIDAGVVASFSGMTVTQANHSALFNSGNLRLTDMTVTGNSSSSGDGAGVFNGGILTAINTTVSNNSVTGVGGGIANEGVGMLLIDVTVAGNSSTSYGGGIYNTRPAVMYDDTISTNAGTNFGGGIFNFFGGTLTLANTIDAQNTCSGSGVGPDLYGTITSLGFNLVGIADGSTGLVSQDIKGSAGTPVNAQLSALGNYGGPTQTMPPTAGSQAIAAGSVSLIPAGITVDQRGQPRTVSNTTDIGSVETGTLTGSLAGSVFNDVNGNGIRNSGDGGLDFWTLYLDLNANGVIDPGEPTTFTTGGGNYKFTQLTPGAYHVQVVAQPGYVQTSVSTTTNVTAFTTSAAPIFGEQPSASATDSHWTELTHAAPGGISQWMLMPDGTVIADVGSGNWAKLTPDATGGYVNGSWSTLASSIDSRLYYSSQVLPDDRVFVAGGEYGTGGGKGEIYDSFTNSWTALPASSFGNFSDSPSMLLNDGRILVAPVSPSTSGGTVLFEPSTNTWSAGPQLFRGSDADEQSWVKLPDGSIITVDSNSTSERFIPSLNQWVNDAAVPVGLYGSTGEMGPSVLLPDGRVLFTGGSGHSALYTPSGTGAPGTWAVGPDFPGHAAVLDSPGAVLPDGTMLMIGGDFSSPRSVAIFNPANNTFASIGFAPTDSAAYTNRMLELPDGTILVSGGAHIWTYNPRTSPLSPAAPTITGVSRNTDGSFTVTGTRFNGLSAGAVYGDDAQMDTNYPIVRLVSSGGTVYYAKSYGWSLGVATGSTPVSTKFALPAGLPIGNYTMTLIVNGVASAATPLTVGLFNTINGSSAADSITLVQDSDHIHVDWIMRYATGVFTQSDVAGLTINGNGGSDVITLDFSRGTPLPANLQLNGAFTINGLSTTNTLLGTKIDIGQSTVYFNYGAGASLTGLIRQYLTNGYNGGGWNGTGGGTVGAITSSTATAGAAGIFGIGYADSADGVVAGQPANTVEIRYTMMGDTNLDGTVSSADAITMARNYLVAGKFAWDIGNFNYDSTIDLTDAALLQKNFNATVTIAAVPTAAQVQSPASGSSDKTSPSATPPPITATGNGTNDASADSSHDRKGASGKGRVTSRKASQRINGRG